MPNDVADWTSSLWTAVGGKTTAGVGADSFTTSAVGVAAQQLMLMINDPGHVGLTGLSVQGVTSGVFYVFATPPAFTIGGAVVVPINGVADLTYLISWATAGAAGIVVTAYESGLPPGFPTTGQNPQSLCVPVVIANDQAIGRSGQQPMADSAPVVVASDQEMPMGQPRSMFAFNASIAAGATLLLVAGVGGQQVRMDHLHLECPTAMAAGANDVEDTAGAQLAFIRSEMTGIRDIPFRGLARALGVGVQLKNNSATAWIVAGSISFWQH